MNALKKYLGIVWMLLGPAVIVFLIWQASDKVGLAYALVGEQSGAARDIAQSNALNTLLQWLIIIIVFLPIAFGLMIFGKYAWSGEYNRLED